MTRRLLPLLILSACFAALLCFLLLFPRPHRAVVERCTAPALAYAVMKAESNFKENAISRAGAVGLMQLMPATAEFVCRQAGIPYDPTRLLEGRYNTELGCRYLDYLLERFPVTHTAIAAYNAGEGSVTRWLCDDALSDDGKTLKHIPYSETATYVQKVEKFLKIYRFYYH